MFMKTAAWLVLAGLLLSACGPSDAGDPGSPAAEPSVDSSANADSGGPGCHPTNDRDDCVVAVVLLGAPVDLQGAEELAEDHNAYLNALFRTDAVCVTKDFPMMPGYDLGETASRRVYWRADERTARIESDQLLDLVPPPTMGGFDTVIDARILDEWQLALAPGVLFDSVVLWIDRAGAEELLGRFDVELPAMGPNFGRYDHREGRGEIRVDRDYEPPPLEPVADPGCVATEFDR